MSRAMLMIPPLKYEAPETPDDEMRLSVASIVSFTRAFIQTGEGVVEQNEECVRGGGGEGEGDGDIGAKVEK